jgi:hypothetical protein
LHAEVARPIPLADLIDRHNTRISQTRGSFGFAAKPFQVRFARPLTKTNDFQSDYAVETLLPRPKHDPLTAATDFFEQFVVAEVSR